MIANPGAGQLTWRYFFLSVVVAPTSLVQDHFLHILYHLCFLVIFLLLWKSTGCATAYLIPVYWMTPSGYSMLILHFVSCYLYHIEGNCPGTLQQSCSHGLDRGSSAAWMAVYRY